jgi:hypothetical protein
MWKLLRRECAFRIRERPRRNGKSFGCESCSGNVPKLDVKQLPLQRMKRKNTRRALFGSSCGIDVSAVEINCCRMDAWFACATVRYKNTEPSSDKPQGLIDERIIFERRD